MNILRPIVATTLLATCLSLALAEPTFADFPFGEDATAPNIIFILVDDVGWTDIRTGDSGPNVLDGVNYGSDYYQTPNLARLAAEGISFTHCFAHPNCAPTRAAILSGQYAPRSGNGVYHVQSLARANRQEKPTRLIPPKQRTDIPAAHIISAESLKAGGYVTAHFGKYHVGGQDGGRETMPENQGYDFNFGGNRNGGPGAYHASGQLFARQIGPELDPFAGNYTASYIQQTLSPLANDNDPAILVNGGKHVEDALGDAAIHFMDHHRNSSASDRPFYLQLHNYANHSPIGDRQARADLLAKYRDVPEGAHHTNPAYAAILENMDQTIGRVLNYLDDPDHDGDNSDSIAAQTLVIFTSDNGGIGPTDNHPLRHVKGSFFNGGIRVPLIVRQPGTVPAGHQTDTLVHSVDFYPTLIDAAGLSMPQGITFDGTSFWAHVLDPVANKRDRDAICYHFPGYLDKRARACDVIVKRIDGRDYKLIYSYDTAYTGQPTSPEVKQEGLQVISDPWELYCFSDDLSESKDLLDGTADSWNRHGEIAVLMAEELSRWLNQPEPDWNPTHLVDRKTSAIVPFPTAESLPQPK